MEQTHNPLKSAELYTEQNTNIIDGILNNAPPIPEEKPLDKVKPPTRKSRTWERERKKSASAISI